MAERPQAEVVLRNMLSHCDLSFRDFMEIALYHPEVGYYSRAVSPVGREGDYVTSPVLSSAFPFALSRLVREFLGRCGDEVPTIVDIGCGDGTLIGALSRDLPPQSARFFGVDRSLGRVTNELRERVAFVRTVDELPRGGAHLIISNELFDAVPFARLVQRGEHLHELWVNDAFDWTAHEATAEYDDYFAARGIELADGQFADVSLEWQALYRDIAGVVERGLIVTFDYGYLESKLFRSRARRFGTAAAYAQQRVTRDLLANPGEQDLTAHINFSDLIRAGEASGFTTRFFDRQSKFLLLLGITEHELFAPSTELEIASMSEGVALMERRDEARRLVLPDGIGHDIHVLAQSRGMGDEPWSFERKLF